MSAVPAAGATMQRGVVRALLRPTLRVTPWGQLASGGLLTVLVVLATAGSPDLLPSRVVEHLRIAMVALAVGVAGALDDPTRPPLDSAAVPLAVRQGLRVAVAVTVAAGWWALALLSATRHPSLGRHAPRDLPLAALTVEVAALVVLVLAVAAAATRTRGQSGVLVAAGAALGAPTLTAVLAMWPPLRHMLYAHHPRLADGSASAAGVAAWRAAHLRWLAVALLAGALLAWALRDPAVARPRWTGIRTPRRRRRGHHDRPDQPGTAPARTDDWTPR